jgi:hypothetical protein
VSNSTLSAIDLRRLDAVRIERVDELAVSLVTFTPA